MDKFSRIDFGSWPNVADVTNGRGESSVTGSSKSKTNGSLEFSSEFGN